MREKLTLILSEADNTLCTVLTNGLFQKGVLLLATETFFATFKKEEACRRDYSSEQDFRKSVDQYIHFYNENRPH
jgi:hypothetical protein